MQEKTCSKCGSTKQISEFSKSVSKKDGLCTYCKQCMKQYKIERKEHISQLNRDYRNNNKEKLLSYQREYSKQHKEHISNRNKKYRELNKEKIKEIEKAYKDSNKEKYKEYFKMYNSKRRKDPYYRLVSNLRRRLHLAVSSQNTQKVDTTFKLTGCTQKELKQHLENQFQEGMTWDNYGEWHIDHIKPCASFDLTDKDQQRECFHYTNCKPEWESDNLSKGSLWEGKRWNHGEAAGLSKSGIQCQHKNPRAFTLGLDGVTVPPKPPLHQ